MNSTHRIRLTGALYALALILIFAAASCPGPHPPPIPPLVQAQWEYFTINPVNQLGPG